MQSTITRIANRLRYLPVLTLILLSTTALGQTQQTIQQQKSAQFTQPEPGCGTHMTEEQHDELLEMLPTLERYEAEYHERRANRDLDELYWVPIKCHIIRTSAGTGGLDSADLADAIQVMNDF